jgi:lipid-binding SYLF domain-containing protein
MRDPDDKRGESPERPGFGDAPTRGLFAGVSLDGAVLKQDRDDNEKLYGRKVSAKEILIEGTVSTPRSAQALNNSLTKYSPKGGKTFARL